MREIKDIIIVGGGDSGLLSALCIKKLNPNIEIYIIDDFEEEIPAIGKSTYIEMMNILHNFLDISENRFISEVKPIWKGSVYFKDWNKSTSFHFSFDVSTILPSKDDVNSFDSCYLFYNNLSNSEHFRTIGGEIVEQRKSPIIYQKEKNSLYRYPSVAYHLSTKRFNPFLRQVCLERDISLINDEIITVDIKNNKINQLRGNKKKYRADLYIDASGFARILRSKLDDNFTIFDIPLDSALVATAGISLSDVTPATVIETGDHGWFWQIDTFDNRDLGYVFSSDFVSDSDALLEFLDQAEEDVSESDVRKYEFNSGFYETPWVENCIAIGNAEGFVEPLQSTGLTSNAESARTLARLLASRRRMNNKRVRESYNDYVQGIWNSVYDFISVHYKYSSGESEFWNVMQSINTSDRVDKYIKKYNNSGLMTVAGEPIECNGTINNMLVFDREHLFIIMAYMNAKSDFYESNMNIEHNIERNVQKYLESIHTRVDRHLTHQDIYSSNIYNKIKSNEIIVHTKPI